jgi:hypothetical protein
MSQGALNYCSDHGFRDPIFCFRRTGWCTKLLVHGGNDRNRKDFMLLVKKGKLTSVLEIRKNKSRPAVPFTKLPYEAQSIVIPAF